MLAEKYPEVVNDIMEEDGSLNPYKIMTIEENWSVRHLFRAPYSLNEKTWLVSVPLTMDKLENFEIDHARMENVDASIGFLDKWREGEAEDLVLEVLDWDASRERVSIKARRITVDKSHVTAGRATAKVSEQFFPPCIKKGLEGLEDGRKRFLFILINFLKLMKWSNDEIQALVDEWNQKKNKEPLRDSYVRAQLKYAFKKHEAYVTPNCDNKDYYLDIGLCVPDKLCERIRNPVTYALKRAEKATLAKKAKSRRGGNRTSRSRSRQRKS